MLAACCLVLVHYLSLNMFHPLSAFVMVGFVMVVQVFATIQFARRLLTRTVLSSQCANGVSWLVIVGVLGIAHFILPSFPELRWPDDVVIFGGFALVSALLSLLTTYVVKLWNGRTLTSG
jgi:hypothetical protein